MPGSRSLSHDSNIPNFYSKSWNTTSSLDGK
jgi:hypothetical protein